MIALAPQTSSYLDRKIKAPVKTWNWEQPLEGTTQKFVTPGLKIIDPLWSPPRREDVVQALLAAVREVLEVEEKLFAVLTGDSEAPVFERPKSLTDDVTHPEWCEPLYRPGPELTTEEERRANEKAFMEKTQARMAEAQARINQAEEWKPGSAVA